MLNFVFRFIDDRSGATAIEYGLIAALVAVSIVVGAGALGDNIEDKFNVISTTLVNSN